LKKGWKAERNPLSGASDQIEEELGKHDVRCWKEEMKIFLQLECKKTNHESVLDIKKEWIDKIDFYNDEFLVFSYMRCQQHFAFMPADVLDEIVEKMKLKKSETFEPRGEVLFGCKREWIEGKLDTVFVVSFLGKLWYIIDLDIYIDAREKLNIETKSTTVADKIKSINTVKELKALKDTEGAAWGTKALKAYYNKLDRLESGDVSYNPDFIKTSQWWLPEEKRFDWNKNTIKSISKKIESFIDGNLEENDDGDYVWVNNKDIDKLESEIETILGLNKKDDRKSSK
jgi:hypothetical protein